SIVPNFDHVTIRFESPPQNMPQLIDLLAEVLRKPALSQADFDLFKNQQLALLAMPVVQPAALAHLHMARREEQYALGDVRRHRENSEVLQEVRDLTLEQVRSF